MALRIIGIDHGSKESLVKECGAEVFLDITKFDDKTLPEEVKKQPAVLELPLLLFVLHQTRLMAKPLAFLDSEVHLFVLECQREIASQLQTPSHLQW